MSQFNAPRRIRSVAPAAAAAVALLATPLSALAVGETFEFRVSNILSPAQPTATVELWAHFDPVDHAFASSMLDVIASESGWSAPTGTLGWPFEPGVIVGARIEEIHVWQFHDGLHLADPSNPIRVWEAQLSASDFAPRTISLTTSTSDFAVWLHPTTSMSASRMLTFIEGAGEIVVIPAPGVGLVFAAGSLLASWRRRR